MFVSENNYKWRHSEGLLTFFSASKLNLPKKLAGFDLDGTLICPLPGRHQFDNDPDNWQWNYPTVIPVLQRLESLDYTIVIFTNQGGWSSKTIAKEGTANKLIRKLGNIMTALLSAGLNPLIYGALNKGSSAPYRKPNSLMYDQFLIDMRQTNRDLQEQFFCGDAAGRTQDHSNCDLEFASKIGVCFFLPEQILEVELGPRKLQRPLSQRYRVDPPREGVIGEGHAQEGVLGEGEGHAQEGVLGEGVLSHVQLILTVGYPGSGKSTYLATHYPNHRIVSQDIVKDGLKTSRPISQVLSEVKLALDQGFSVVVDRTNMTRVARAPFLSFGVPTKILWFNLDLETAYAGNAVRDHKVPKIVYYKMRKEFEEPTLNESTNITDIIKIY